MQADLRFQLNFRDALQGLAQNSSFELQLALVRNVLVMASAALAKVWTTSFNAIGRWLDQVRHRAAREPRLLLPYLGFNSLTRKHKGDKDRHAAAVGGGRRARQAVAAVD